MNLLSGHLKDFHIRRVNDNKHLLHTTTPDNFKLAVQILKQNEIQFFTYTPRTDKNLTVLLKDLKSDFNTKEILDALINQKIENLQFLSVKKFETRRLL